MEERHLPKLSAEETSRLIDDLIAGRPVPPEPDVVGLEHAVGEILDDAMQQAFGGMTHIVRKQHPEDPLPAIAMKAHALAYVAARIYRATEALTAFVAWEQAGDAHISAADTAISGAIRMSLNQWRGLMRFLVAQDMEFFVPPAAGGAESPYRVE